jgi:hypothetical protein
MRIAAMTLLITMLALNSYPAPLVNPYLPSAQSESLQQLTDKRGNVSCGRANRSTGVGVFASTQTKDSQVKPHRIKVL